jgi:hypothetical protein
MRNYRHDIIDLYTQILKESPDSISVRGDRISYDEVENYTGYLNSAGKFVMSAHTSDHGDFRQEIARGQFYDDRYKKVRGKIPIKTNCSSEAEVRSLVSNSTDYDAFRIWLSEDAISFWSKASEDIFNGAINAIESLGDDPEKYLFNPMDDDGGAMLSFEEFKQESIGSDMSEERQRSKKDKREFANYLLRRKDGD